MRQSRTRLSNQAFIEAVKHPETLVEASLPQWDSIIRLAKRSNLIGRLAEGVHRQGVMEQLPAQVQTHLKSARVLTQHQRQAITWETRHIVQALGAPGVPLVLLKGSAYAMADLAAARGRLFGDVDVLLPKASMQQAEAALMLNGWATGHTDPYDDRYYRRWMHELPPMTHRKRGTVIDVHHNILPLTARNSPPAERLLEDSVPLPASGVRVLSPCDMVIHSATHLFHEGELQNGLRDLFDLDALLMELSQRDVDFWNKLTTRAQVLDLSWPLFLALRYTRLVLGTAVPPSVEASMLDSSVPNVISLRVLDALYLRALRPDHPICNETSTAVARFLIYLRSHYLKMPMRLLVIHLGRKAFMRLFKNTSRSV
jgi:hypothetical protein